MAVALKEVHKTYQMWVCAFI